MAVEALETIDTPAGLYQQLSESGRIGGSWSKRLIQAASLEPLGYKCLSVTVDIREKGKTKSYSFGLLEDDKAFNLHSYESSWAPGNESTPLPTPSLDEVLHELSLAKRDEKRYNKAHPTAE